MPTSLRNSRVPFPIAVERRIRRNLLAAVAESVLELEVRTLLLLPGEYCELCDIEGESALLRVGSNWYRAHIDEVLENTKPSPDGAAPITPSSDDAIIQTDLNGVITSWNHSAQRLFGYTAKEAIGQTVVGLLIPEEREDEEPAILARLKNGERIDHFEAVRRRKDGAFIDVSLTISPMKDDDGNIIGASKLGREISDCNRAH